MNTAEQEIEIRETAGIKSCNDCSRELREGDRFCRRCGADQNGSPAGGVAGRGRRLASSYRTASLAEADDCRRFSGSLMKSLVGNVSARASRINNRFAKLVISMLAVAPIWLVIVLLAPFDAYFAARSIADED